MILGRQVDLVTLVHQPPLVLRIGEVGELNLDDGPAGREARRVNATAHVPQEHASVHLILCKCTPQPPLAPFPKVKDKGFEF